MAAESSPRFKDKRELGSLNSRLEAYVSQMRRLSSDRDRLTNKVRQLMNDHDRTMTDREQKHEAETERLRNQIRSLAAKADKAQTEQQRLEQELKTLQDDTAGWEDVLRERDTLKGQVDAAAARMHRLEGLLDAAEDDRDKYMAQVQEHAAKVKDLELRLAASESRHDETKDDLEAAHTAIRRLTEEVSAAGGETSEYQATVRELREAIAELTTAVAARDEAIADMRRANEAAAAKAADTIKSLREENQSLRDHLVEDDDRIVGLTEKLGQAEQDAANEANAHRDEVAGYERRLADAEVALVKAKAAHASELAKAQGRIHEAEAAAADARREAGRESAAQVRELEREKSVLEEELSAYRTILEAEESRIGLPTPARRGIERLLKDTDVHIMQQEDNEEADEEEEEGSDHEAGKVTIKRERSSNRTPAKRVARNTRSHGPAHTVTSHAPGSSGISLRVDLRRELALVVNEGTESCDLTDWTLHSEGGQHFEFPDGQVVGPLQAVLIWSGPRGAENRDLHESSFYWTSQPVWNNKGDLARLVDADGEIAFETHAKPTDPPLDVSAARKDRAARGASSAPSSSSSSSSAASTVTPAGHDRCVVM